MRCTCSRCWPQQSNAPKWNFYKYVVDRQGKVMANFSSLTKPDSPDLIEAVEKAVGLEALIAAPLKSPASFAGERGFFMRGALNQNL